MPATPPSLFDDDRRSASGHHQHPVLAPHHLVIEVHADHRIGTQSSRTLLQFLQRDLPRPLQLLLVGAGTATHDVAQPCEHILEDVEKNKIPVQFIKKLIIKLEGKKQQTLNIEKFLSQGLDPDQIEEVVSRKLQELDESVVGVEFLLNVQNIADAVRPETDKILGNL